MSDLIVLAFDSEDGAGQMRDRLIQLQKQHIVSLEDAAVVVRRPDGKVKVKQVTSLAGAGALGGAFWGMLIGLIFAMPWLGLAIGALAGGVSGKFADIGVDDKFIREVGSTIEPGNSAIFLLVRDATTDKLDAELAQFNATVVQTSLSFDQEAKLRHLVEHESVVSVEVEEEEVEGEEAEEVEEKEAEEEDRP